MVGQSKMFIRRMLKAANLGTDYWPVAARHLNEMLKNEAVGPKNKWPQFYDEVWVRKRRWNLTEMGPTQEKVRYLASSCLCRGHWIEKEGGKRALTRMVLQGLKEVPDDAHLRAAREDEISPLEVRRRIRGEATVRSLQIEKLEEDENEDEKAKIEEVRRFEALIQDETICMGEDVYEGVLALKALKDGAADQDLEPG